MKYLNFIAISSILSITLYFFLFLTNLILWIHPIINFVLFIFLIVSVIPIAFLGLNYLINQRIQEYQKNSYHDNFVTTFVRNTKSMDKHHKWKPVKIRSRQ